MLLSVFGIGKGKIISGNHSVPGVVTQVRTSWLHTEKKPVRLYPSERNTLFSHYIFFDYTVEEKSYSGKLYVDLRYRCPQKGEQITVYYDINDPRKYACCSFGPAVRPIGW